MVIVPGSIPRIFMLRFRPRRPRRLRHPNRARHRLPTPSCCPVEIRASQIHLTCNHPFKCSLRSFVTARRWLETIVGSGRGRRICRIRKCRAQRRKENHAPIVQRVATFYKINSGTTPRSNSASGACLARTEDLIEMLPRQRFGQQTAHDHHHRCGDNAGTSHPERVFPAVHHV